MTVGEKIRKYRTMLGMTQKKLGEAAGFLPATADSRIRKYESNNMAPKDDIRIRLANALEADISALSDIDIRNYDDVMQILFFFEEEYGMKIERTVQNTCLVFDNKNKNIDELISYLYTWYKQIKDISDESGNIGDDSLLEYRKWKARFPQDIKNYWREQQSKIDSHYSPLVKKYSKNSSSIETYSDFIKLIRTMIQHNITIKTEIELFGTGDAGLKLSFFTSELLDSTDKKIEKIFTEFLYNLDILGKYGMPISTNMLTDESGTRIIYCLRLSPLTIARSTIEKIIKYENTYATKNDYDIELFESNYESELSTNDFNLKEAIEYQYPH